MSVVFDKVDRKEFESGRITGNARHFDEKRPKITGNWSASREFEAPSNSGGLGDAPGRGSDSEYDECAEVDDLQWRLDKLQYICTAITSNQKVIVMAATFCLC